MGKLDLNIWITTICNFRCTYCYEIKDQELVMTKREAEDTVTFVIDYIKKNSIQTCNIHFHGGEPLLYSDIILYFIEEFKHYTVCQFKYSLTTNGTIYSDKIEEILVNEIDNVSISIDGPKHVFNLCRKSKAGKDYFDIIISNAKELLKRKEDTRIRMTVVPENVEYLYENIQYFLQHGFKYITHAIDYGNKDWTEDAFNQYYEQIVKLRSYITNNNLHSLAIDGARRMGFIDRGKCQGGLSSLSIYPDGKIYPCTIVAGNRVYDIGDVNKGIDKSWLSQLEAINSLCMDECQGCSLIKNCFSNRCRLFNKVLTGSYNKPSGNVCAVQNIMYRLYNESI